MFLMNFMRCYKILSPIGHQYNFSSNFLNKSNILGKKTIYRVSTGKNPDCLRILRHVFFLNR